MVMARAIQLTIVTRVGLLLINRSKTNMVSPAFITIHPVMVQSTDIVNKGRIMDNSITDVRIISSCTLPKLATNENIQCISLQLCAIKLKRYSSNNIQIIYNMY